MKSSLSFKILGFALVSFGAISLWGVFSKHKTVRTTALVATPVSTTTLSPEFKDALEMLSDLEDSIRQTDEAIAQLERTQPIRPQRAEGAQGLIFDVDFEPQDFPEIACYEGVSFSLDINRSAMEKRHFDSVWTSCVITRGTKIDDIELTVSNQKEQATFFVFPVFKGKAFGKAMKLFERKMVLYQAKFKRLQANKVKFEKKYEELRAMWKADLAKIHHLVEEKGRKIQM